jgi:hypothetical protein
MKSFETIFNNWISSKVEFQLKIIDNIASETGVDPEKWFIGNFLRQQLGDYTEDNFLNVLLQEYISYLSNEFDKIIGVYLESDKHNIYGEPIYDIYITLEYDFDNNNIFINEEYGERVNIEKVIQSVSLNNRSVLMKNKLFSYIINKTNLNIFSKKDIRALKLKQLNEI